MHLYIRTDANGKIGAGHIMRCIALAQAWQYQGGEVTFISCCENDPIRERITQEGFSFVSIVRPHPHSSDLTQTLNIIESKRPNDPSSVWLVLDGYHFTPEYQKAIRDTGNYLLVIDDMNHLPQYHANILLNQNIHAPDLNYHCDEDTALLLGTRYVLLRREFLKYRGFKRQIPDQAKNILVTLGGADPDNVTLKVIEALKLLDYPEIEVKIIIGPANPHQNLLSQTLFSSFSAFELLINPPDMPELMAWADLAISAAGSTCWELAFMQLPFVAIVAAENQCQSAQKLANRLVTVFNVADNMFIKNIVHSLKYLLNNKIIREKLSGSIQNLIDGAGVNRTMQACNGNRGYANGL